MLPKDYFIVVFIITILVIRIFTYLYPIPSPTVKGFRLHHYMYGLVIVPVGILLGSIAVYAVGLGLFVDEFGYLLIGGKTHEDNYSKWSLILLGIFMILVYIFRSKLIGFF